MKKADFIIITSYDCGGGFFVDLVENTREKKHEAYIYNIGYGVKSLMFGVSALDCNHHKFFTMVENSVDEYKQDYVDEFMND